MSVLNSMPVADRNALIAACKQFGFRVSDLPEIVIDSTCWRLGSLEQKHVSIAVFNDGTWGWSIVSASGQVLDHNII